MPEIKRSVFGYIDWAVLPPMEALARYELMVPPTSDPMYDKIGNILARYEGKEQWDRFQKAWDLAKDKYGYSDEWLERTWQEHSLTEQ